MLVTPVVWLVLDGVAQRLEAATVDHAARWVTGALRRLFRRPAPAVEVRPLTREQLAGVRALVLATAEQRGLLSGRAEEIADAVVARLALADGPGALAPQAPEPRPSGRSARSRSDHRSGLGGWRRLCRISGCGSTRGSWVRERASGSPPCCSC
ncbi:hypothetical protein NKH18_18805 [Streptomyces sp. M10(2022)]